jgi:hypothetical protein
MNLSYSDRPKAPPNIVRLLILKTNLERNLMSESASNIDHCNNQMLKAHAQHRSLTHQQWRLSLGLQAIQTP